MLFLAGITCYLLFAPIYLIADSRSGFYGVRFHRIALARLVLPLSSFKIEIGVAGWTTRLDLLKSGSHQKKLKPTSKAKSRFNFNKALNILKTFKIKRCDIQLDTGNMPLNGMLYPVFYAFGAVTGRPISVNFINENAIALEIENNLARIVRAIIYSHFKYKHHGKLK